MRIWDIDPGFLNDQSLLGEHRELHGLMSIHINKKKGYSRHPETTRWAGALTGLYRRHQVLVEEMTLRGMTHKSPMETVEGPLAWPGTSIDAPHRQFELLAAKYQGKPQGRIPLPKNSMTLWASHKYSVMARDPAAYKQIGPAVASGETTFDQLSSTLVRHLRHPPPPGRLTNALDHMWGYVSDVSRLDRSALDLRSLLEEIQRLAGAGQVTYLTRSTALGELGGWF